MFRTRRFSPLYHIRDGLWADLDEITNKENSPMFRTKRSSPLSHLRNGVWVVLEEVTRITPFVSEHDISVGVRVGEIPTCVRGFSSEEEAIAWCGDLAARVNAAKGHGSTKRSIVERVKALYRSAKEG